MPEAMFSVKVDLKEVGYVQGTRGWCPIANAIKLHHLDTTWVQVDENEIRLTQDGVRFTFATPVNAQAFIRKVDEALDEAAVAKIRPFSLTLTRNHLLDQRETRVRSMVSVRTARIRAIRQMAEKQGAIVLAAPAAITIPEKTVKTTKAAKTVPRKTAEPPQVRRSLRGARALERV